MLLVWIGAFLVISGTVLMAFRTLRGGRLSDPSPPTGSDAPVTLEPKGRGDRLSLKADLPGVGLVALGGLLLLAAVFVR